MWQLVPSRPRRRVPAAALAQRVRQQPPDPAHVLRRPRRRARRAANRLCEDDRLVTLTGAGGCGQDAPRVHAAAEVADRHPDGVRWVELAPVSSPDAGAVRRGPHLRVRRGGGPPADRRRCASSWPAPTPWSYWTTASTSSNPARSWPRRCWGRRRSCGSWSPAASRWGFPGS